MRPAEISDEAVIEAGNALLAAGRRITGWALRAQIGAGKAERLEAVWEAHVGRSSAAPAGPAIALPAELAELLQKVSGDLVAQLQRLVTDMHQRAVRAAEERVIEALRGAAEVEAKAKQAGLDAGKVVEDLERQRDEAREQLEAERARLVQAHEAAQHREVEHATLRQRLTSAELTAKAAAEAHAAELAQVRGGMDRLRDDLTRQVTEQTALVRARDQQVLDERTSAEARMQEWSGQVEQLTTQLQAARDEVSQCQARSQAVQEQHRTDRATAAKAAQELAEKLTKVQAERDDALRDAHQAREAVARLEGRTDSLATHTAELMALLRALGGDRGDSPPPGPGPAPVGRKRGS